jgi:predicted RNase H-like HicB family nuclease
MVVKPTYTALAQRDGTWWAIRVVELRGVFSQAKRLDRVEYMARDAIALLLEVDPGSFDVVVREHLDAKTRQVVEEAVQARDEALERQRIATTKSREAARTLHRQGLPQRDIGRLLKLSHQRVAQLLDAAGS